MFLRPSLPTWQTLAASWTAVSPIPHSLFLGYVVLTLKIILLLLMLLFVYDACVCIFICTGTDTDTLAVVCVWRPEDPLVGLVHSLYIPERPSSCSHALAAGAFTLRGISLSFFFFFFKTRSWYIYQACLELTMQLRLSLNLWGFSCLSLLNAGIANMSFYGRFLTTHCSLSL